MTVGAKDYIDQLLVKKYSDKQMNNLTATESAVPAGKMIELMDDVASTKKTMLTLQLKLANKIQNLSSNMAYKKVRPANC